MTAPTVTPLASSVDQNGWARFSSMFTATDPDLGGFITQYEFFDNTQNAGTSYFWVNGATPVSDIGHTIVVSAADLATVWLHGGTSIGGSDALLVRAYDNSGAVSNYEPILLTTQAPSVGANIIRGGSGNDALAGTPGDDILYGNDGNDTLNGNVGNDFLDGGAGLDIARFSGLMSSYTITRVGTSGTVSGPDGTDNFSSIERLQFDDNTLALAVPKNDFGGDGKSDILWHNVNGQLSIWQMDGQTLVSAGAVVSIPPAWQIGGVADFNGDGKSDILWRHTSGAVAEWNMDGTAIASGGLVAGGGTVPADWQVAGVGDFGGDGKSDILWHHTSGQLSMWQMDGQTLVSAGAVVSIPTAWQVAGVADFNGDGKSDILWRHTSGAVAEWNMDGTAIASGGVVAGGAAVPADWIIT